MSNIIRLGANLGRRKRASTIEGLGLEQILAIVFGTALKRYFTHGQFRGKKAVVYKEI